MFQVTNSQKKIPLSLSSAEAVIIFLTEIHDQPPMSVHFVGKKKISKLHAQLFDDPSPTDCITLPFHDPLFLGEVLVCPEVAADYVSKEGGDLEEEITLYVVHGFLHLIGFNDIDCNDKKSMRKAEQKLMTKLAKNNLRVRIEQ